MQASRYLKLPPTFFAESTPAKLTHPRLLIYNQKLAQTLGLEINQPEQYLSGQKLFPDTTPIALAYAGHQFGHFVPRLGDGRAHLLGEFSAPSGENYELQLKGSGRTPYSRGGDGKSPLGPALREYLISEAIAAYGIPTTRCLSVVETGEEVMRQEVSPGAIVSRLARRHIRVGTFEFFAAQNDLKNLQKLLEFTIENLYPNQASNPIDFFKYICEGQAKLVAQWMSVGFIHGVMNTDNTSLALETIDYGPCAFMDQFKSEQVYSSIDRHGRYAYINQPNIMHWNLSVLGQTLVMLSDDPKSLQLQLDQFPKHFEEAFKAQFSRKFGLEKSAEAEFINLFLNYLEKHKLDFTQAFRKLPELYHNSNHLFYPKDALKDQFLYQWKEYLTTEDKPFDLIEIEMNTTNPYYIPRNHIVEEALSQAEQGNLDLYLKILEAIQSPYQALPIFDFLDQPPTPQQVIKATFCGT